MRSVASGRRLSTRSSTCSRSAGIELLVHRELAGVDDRHVEAGLDRVIEEDRVHRLAHARRRAERERQVRDAARDLGAGQLGLDAAHGLDEVDRVRVVLLDAGADRQDVRIEDDVLGREPDLLGQDLVGAVRDRERGGRPSSPGRSRRTPSRRRRRRTGGRSVAWRMNSASPSLSEIELTTPLPCRHSRPASITRELRRVDHHRDARDVGLGGDQVQEPPHRGDAVEHALVHADVEDVGAALDLLARDRDRLVVLVVLDEATERGRAGDVRALADHDEVRLRRDRQRLEARTAACSCGGVRDRAARARPRPPRGSRGCARGACRSSRRRG